MGFFAEASLKKIGASLTASFILTVGIFYGMQLLIAVEVPPKALYSGKILCCSSPKPKREYGELVAICASI